jgi:hypothetical protein
MEGGSQIAELRTGGCLCGGIRYESSGETVFALQCHCRDCQRQSGSAFVAAARVPAAEFRITKGTPKRYIAKADSGNEITRVFCPDCGSPLYVQVSTRPDLVGIRVGSFDDPSWFRPEADIFVKSAQPWDYMNPDIPKYPAYPPGRSYLPEAKEWSRMRRNAVRAYSAPVTASRDGSRNRSCPIRTGTRAKKSRPRRRAVSATAGLSGA